GPNHEPSWVHSLNGKPLYRNEESLVYYVEKKPEAIGHAGTIVYVDGFSDKIINQVETDDVREWMSQKHRWYGDFFSVGSLFQFLHKKFAECDMIREFVPSEMLANWWKEYALTHLAANPKAKDFSTKQALLEDAEKRFLQVATKIPYLVKVEEFGASK